MALDKFIKEIWTAADDDGNECGLDKVNDRYCLDMTKGRWRGYPHIDLTRDQLINLHDVIRKELGYEDMK